MKMMVNGEIGVDVEYNPRVCDIEIMLSDLRNRLLEWRGSRHQGNISSDRSATACMTAAWMSGAQNFGILDNDEVISIAERIRELGNNSQNISYNEDDDNHVRQDARLLLDARICLENALIALNPQEKDDDDCCIYNFNAYQKETDDNNDDVISDIITLPNIQPNTPSIRINTDEVLNEKTSIFALCEIFDANMTLQECIDILKNKKQMTVDMKINDIITQVDNHSNNNEHYDDDDEDHNNETSIDETNTENVEPNKNNKMIDETIITEQQAPSPEPYPAYFSVTDIKKISLGKELQLNYDGDICIPLQYNAVEITEAVSKRNPTGSLYDRNGHFLGPSQTPSHSTTKSNRYSDTYPFKGDQSMARYKSPSTYRRMPRPIGQLLDKSFASVYESIDSYDFSSERESFVDTPKKIERIEHDPDSYERVIRRRQESHRRGGVDESKTSEMALRKSRLKMVQLQADMARVGYGCSTNRVTSLNKNAELARSRSAPPRRTTSIFQRTKNVSSSPLEKSCDRIRDDSLGEHGAEVAEVARKRAALRIKQKKVELENRKKIEEQTKMINERLKWSERDRKIANFVERQSKSLSSPHNVSENAIKLQPWNIDSPLLYKANTSYSRRDFSPDALAAVGLSDSEKDLVEEYEYNFHSNIHKSENDNRNKLFDIIEQAQNMQKEVKTLMDMKTPDFKQLQEKDYAQSISPISIAGLQSLPSTPELKSEVISICIKQAFDLSDALGGTNPYIVLDWGHLGRVSTKTIIGSNSPKFDTVFVFESPYRLVSADNDAKEGRIVYASNLKYLSNAPQLQLFVYSKNQSVSDELIGEAEVNADGLFCNGYGVVELYDLNDEFAGSVELSVHF